MLLSLRILTNRRGLMRFSPITWFSTHADGKLILYPMVFRPNRRFGREKDLIERVMRLNLELGRLSHLSFSRRWSFLEGTGSMGCGS